jgi:hypothetical protein
MARLGRSRDMMPPQAADRAVTQPSQSESKGRVLPFQPRGSLFSKNAPPSPVADIDKYERTPDEPDDFRHRMKMNGLALGATVVLIAVGLWIATVMSQLRKDQDCVLTGRASCSPIAVPVQPR